VPNDLKYPVFKLEYNKLQFIVIIIIIDVFVPFLYTTAMIISLVKFPCNRHIKYCLEYSAVYGFWPVDGVSGAGGRACWVRWVAKGKCLFAGTSVWQGQPSLRRRRQKEWTKHDAVAALVTRS